MAVLLCTNHLLRDGKGIPHRDKHHTPLQHRHQKSIHPRVSLPRQGSSQLGYPKVLLTQSPPGRIMSCDKTDLSLAQFWSRMSLELFQNVALLFEQIDTQHSSRSPNDGLGAQMSVCVHTRRHTLSHAQHRLNGCDRHFAYIRADSSPITSAGIRPVCCPLLSLREPPRSRCQWRARTARHVRDVDADAILSLVVCPDKSITSAGPRMLQRCMDILSECKSIWPLASRWYELLENSAKVHKMGPTKEASMSDSVSSSADSPSPVRGCDVDN